MHRRKFLAASAALSAMPFVPAIAKSDGLTPSNKPSLWEHGFTIYGTDDIGVKKDIASLELDTPFLRGRMFHVRGKLRVVDLAEDVSKYTGAGCSRIRYHGVEYESEIPIGVYLSKEMAFTGEYFNIACPTGPWRLPRDHLVAKMLGSAIYSLCLDYDYRAIAQSLPATPILA